MRVLVTGANGAVGRPVVRALKADGHDVRGFDRDAGESVTHRGDLTDAAAVRAAVEGVEVVVHLAACPDVADFVTKLVPANVVGLYHVLDACREHGVRRVSIASTLRVAGRYDPVATVEHRAPRDFYALTKLWAEEMAALFVRKHGMSILAARIGWLPRHARAMDDIRDHGGGGPALYLSHDDAGRFYSAFAQSSFEGFRVAYAVSRPPAGVADKLDPTPAREAIGYEPRDRFPDGCQFDR